MGSRNESKAEKDRHKQIQDKCQTLLTQMLRDEDNKYCVDCDAKGPRWASWNLGVFLCIRCAGIHRNLGVHISKVKSVNLDSWTPEQVVSLQQMGNSRARAVYEATLPDTWRRPQTDSSLDTFIRAKYQTKRYIAKEWVPSPLPKVDWDKELDQEAERLKKKKKDKQSNATVPPPASKPSNFTVRVPALPKPTSSPKSSRASSAATEETKPSSAVDLLGLTTSAPAETGTSNGNSDDVFSSFLSAPPPQAPAVAPVPATPAVAELSDLKGRSAEEDSFFNQAAPGSEPKKPLSKDSILALYSSQAAPPPQQNMFQTQGMFPANPSMAFPTTAATGFPAPATAPGGFPAPTVTGGYPAPTATGGFSAPAFPASGFPANGGFPGITAGGFPAPSPFVNGMHAGAPAAAANPFFGMSMGMRPPAFPAQHGSNKPSDDLLVDFMAASTAPNALPQQLAGLNLSQPAMQMPANVSAMTGATFPANFVNVAPQASMGQTFTTNLWQ